MNKISIVIASILCCSSLNTALAAKDSGQALPSMNIDTDGDGKNDLSIPSGGNWYLNANEIGGLNDDGYTKEGFPVIEGGVNVDSQSDSLYEPVEGEKLDQNLLDNFYAQVPEGKLVNPALLSSPFENIKIKDDYTGADIKLDFLFLNEGAGYKNTVGYIIYETNDQGQAVLPGTDTVLTIENVQTLKHVLILPNASKGNKMLVQGDEFRINETLQPGQSIGFFLNSDGWSVNKGATQKTSFKYARLLYSLPELNPTVGLGDRYHVVFNDTESTGNEDFLAFGFEDIITSGGDKDFNDLVFGVRVTPGGAIEGLEDAVSLDPLASEQQNTNVKLAFEDQWPLTDDYDFNDLVVELQKTKSTASYDASVSPNDLVTQLKIDYTIEAIGASYRNGLMLRLPGISLNQIKKVYLQKTGARPSSFTFTDDETPVETVTFKAGNDNEGSRIIQYAYPLVKEDDDGILFTLSENLFEELSSYDDTNVYVYDSLICFYRTVDGNCPAGTSANKLSLVIDFKVPEDSGTNSNDWVSTANIDEFNLDHFLFATHKEDNFSTSRHALIDGGKYNSGKDQLLEIHLKEHPGSGKQRSDLATKIKDSKSGEKNSKPRFITDDNNLPWALELPITWQHPKEGVDMNFAYPDFVKWLESPDNNKNWYQSNVQTNNLFTE